MRTKMNAQGHDESQYLPRGVPPVNPFRAKHGKIEWVNQTLHAKTWMPDILTTTLNENGKPLFETEHLETCIRLFKALVATNQALKISDLHMQLASEEIQGMPRNPKDIYFAIMRELLPHQSNLCWWVICDDRNHGNVELATHLISSIQNSLVLAEKVIDSLREVCIIPIPASPEVSLNRG